MVLSADAAKQLVVDVGIWWNCPQLSVRTAAVVDVYSAKTVLGSDLIDRRTDAVEVVARGNRETLFAFDLASGRVDVAEALQVVVDAATNAVAQAVGPHGHP